MPALKSPKGHLALVYLICVAIATLLWLQMSIGNTPTDVEVTVPIDYTDEPQNREPSQPRPKELTVKVSWSGRSFFAREPHLKMKKLTLSVENSINNKDIFKVSSKELKEMTSALFDSQCSILSISPKKIEVPYSSVISQRFPVQIDALVTTKKQYILKKEITANPKSILITGPSSTLDTINYISTERLVLNEINQSTEGVLKLNIPENTNAEIDEVSYEVEVELSTTASRDIKIESLHVPLDSTLTLFPARVTLSYEVGLSRYDESLSDTFLFVVDYDKIEEGNGYLEVTPQRVPDYIRNITFSPHTVEYIIE